MARVGGDAGPEAPLARHLLQVGPHAGHPAGVRAECVHRRAGSAVTVAYQRVVRPQEQLERGVMVAPVQDGVGQGPHLALRNSQRLEGTLGRGGLTGGGAGQRGA